MPPDTVVVTDRCYCGNSRISTQAAPLTVTYCHCNDCRRITGGPVGCFAAFELDAITIETAMEHPRECVSGVRRWFCLSCGSPLAATYDYLPGQIYFPIGLLDQAADLAPEQHSHADNALQWLQLSDDLPRFAASGRARLNATGKAD